MKMTMARTLAAGFAAAMLTAMPAKAETTFNAAGIGKAIDSSVVNQVGEGHLLVLSMNSYSGFEPADAANPMKNLSGKCYGHIEIRGPVPSGGGYCRWTDSTGGDVLIHWTPTHLTEEGGTKGMWVFVNGTDKWESVSGGGAFTVSLVGDTANRINTITGAYTMR